MSLLSSTSDLLSCKANRIMKNRIMPLFRGCVAKGLWFGYQSLFQKMRVYYAHPLKCRITKGDMLMLIITIVRVAFKLSS